MEKLLEKGSTCLKEGKLFESEHFFSEVIKICQSQEPREYEKSIPAFHGLIEVYMKNGDSESLPIYCRQDRLIKAAVLCHYVVNVRKSLKNKNSYHGAGITEEEAGDYEMVSHLCCIENELLKTMPMAVRNVADLGNDTVHHKGTLVKLRKNVQDKILKVEKMVDFNHCVGNDVEPFIAEMKSINHIICKSMQGIVERMIVECQQFLGKPPCEYVAVGLGSFAFGTMTPYSDLEWAVLIDVEDESCKSYFRNLAYLVHFKIASLGETIVPSVMVESLNSEHDSWFYDDVTYRGFAVDGAMSKACKTPLGRRDVSSGIVFELIHSPEEMAIFQNQEWLEKSFELPVSLRSFRVLYSSDRTSGDKIMERYSRELKNQLECYVDEESLLSEDKPITVDSCCLPEEIKGENGESGKFEVQDESVADDSIQQKSETQGRLESSSVVLKGTKTSRHFSMRKHHVKKVIKNDLPKYHLHDVTCTSDSEGMIYNVKKDLYRQPERLLCILLLKFGIESTDVYDGIEELHKSGFIDVLLKNDLFVSLSIACEMRLGTYLDYGKQLEGLDIPPLISRCNETSDKTPKARLDRLVQFYRVVLPFVEKVIEIGNETVDELRPIVWECSNPDYSSSHYNALVHLRLLRYDDARYFSLKAIHANPAEEMNWKILARSLEKQGKHFEAYLSHLKSFYIHFVDDNKILNFFKEINEAHGIRDVSAEVESAIHDLLVEREKSDIRFLLTCLHRMALNLFFNSQNPRAWQYLRIAYHLLLNFPFLRRGDAIPAVFNSVALCLSAVGRHRDAERVLKEILSDDTSLSAIQIPKARDNLGNVYFRSGNYSLALDEYRKALKLRRQYYKSSNSLFLVISLVNIANALFKIAQFVNSIKNYKEALKVSMTIYNNPHAIYTELCYSGIGKSLISMGKYREALAYCEKSVKVAKMREHGDTSTYGVILFGLANCYLYLERFDDAVRTYEESMGILQSIKINFMDEEETPTVQNEIVAVYCNLAVALQRQGKFDVAMGWLQKSEEMMESYVNKESHSDVAVVFHTKAKVLRSQGRVLEGLKAMEKALAIFYKCYGDDCPHPSIITTLVGLGDVLVSQRQFKSAVVHYSKAISLLTNDIIPEDALIQLKIDANKNIGYVYYQLKQTPNAIAYYNKALDIWKFACDGKLSTDIDRASILSLHLGAGNAYIQAANMQQAIKFYKVALETPDFVNNGVFDMKMVAWTLAAMQQKIGLLREAIESFQKASSLHESNNNPKDSFLVKCYQNQAALYTSVGDHENACLLSEKALDTHVAIVDSKPHESRAKLLAQVAEAWSYKDPEKALEFGRRSLGVIEEIGGPLHLRCNVMTDVGFYCHLHAIRHVNLNERRRLFDEAEISYVTVLDQQRNESTLFNMVFLYMSTSRLSEAIEILIDILEASGKNNVIGLDERDGKLLNEALSHALFSQQDNLEVVCRSKALAHCLKILCYKMLGNNIKASQELSELENFVSLFEEPNATDSILVNFANSLQKDHRQSGRQGLETDS